MTVSTLC